MAQSNTVTVISCLVVVFWNAYHRGYWNLFWELEHFSRGSSLYGNDSIFYIKFCGLEEINTNIIILVPFPSFDYPCKRFKTVFTHLYTIQDLSLHIYLLIVTEFYFDCIMNETTILLILMKCVKLITTVANGENHLKYNRIYCSKTQYWYKKMLRLDVTLDFMLWLTF